jgi:hypothetical protein
MNGTKVQVTIELNKKLLKRWTAYTEQFKKMATVKRTSKVKGSIPKKQTPPKKSKKLNEKVPFNEQFVEITLSSKRKTESISDDECSVEWLGSAEFIIHSLSFLLKNHPELSELLPAAHMYNEYLKDIETEEKD